MTDGVIKYNFTFTQTEPLTPHLWEEIEEVRERLYALRLIGEKDGIGYGNISRRTLHENFVITGTQTGNLPHLQAEHYAKIESWDEKAFRIHSSGAAKPSSEALTHATIYNLSPKIQAVIHIHSLSLWEFMMQNDYKKTADVPYGSQAMTREVQRIYTQTDPLKDPKFVMRGHREGIITFGKDLKEAEEVLYGVIGAYILNTKTQTAKEG